MRRVVVLATLLAACASTRPLPTAPEAPTTFDHAAYASVLERFVDEDGRVDYVALQAESTDLERYLDQLGWFSPDSHPALFPTRDHQLAYWLNAYNAQAMWLALQAYPLDSVLDVRTPRWAFFLPGLVRFFLLRRFELGGHGVTLYGLENVVVRKRFDDPRVHFALNCASVSCPRLPRVPFEGDRLQEQLAEETRLFLSEPRNVHIDPAAGVVTLSEIFDFYPKDFGDLRTYLDANLDDEARERLRDCAECRIEFRDYDWSLNDQPR